LRRSAENIQNEARFEPSGNRRLVPFLDRQKNAAIPAIRANVNAAITIKMADFRQSAEVLA
jgi:hypothetical protein